MYAFLLIVHNWLRWIVVAAAAYALIRAVVGWLGKRDWTSADRRAGVFFAIAVDTQLLIGILLSFLSPLLRAALADLSAFMAVEELRFFAVEHLPLMIAVVLIVHLGNSLARKAGDDSAKHRRAALWYTLAVLAIAVAVPWWRPLLRGLG